MSLDNTVVSEAPFFSDGSDNVLMDMDMDMEMDVFEKTIVGEYMRRLCEELENMLEIPLCIDNGQRIIGEETEDQQCCIRTQPRRRGIFRVSEQSEVIMRVSTRIQQSSSNKLMIRGCCHPMFENDIRLCLGRVNADVQLHVIPWKQKGSIHIV